MSFWKRLFCSHNYEVWYNLYGDEIIWNDYARSKWKCSKCGKIQLRDDLVDGAPARPDVQGMIDDYHRRVNGIKVKGEAR